MRVPLRSPLVAFTVVAAATGALVAAGPVALAAPGAAVAAPARIVELVTGDTVRIASTPQGRTAVEVVTAARSGPASQWSRLAAGNHFYVVPAVARPYLGGVLDPALFDVTAPVDGATVDVTFPKGHPAAVPGLTVTSSTATTAHGRLDTTGARRFGAALLQQYRRDGAGRTAPTSLFGATRIARSGVTPPVRPDFPQVTLTIRTLLPTGKPGGFGAVGIVNTDDARKYVSFVFPENGLAKVSVPLGHYGLIGDIGTFDAATATSSDAIVSVPEATVSRDGQTIDLDARTATVVPSISTPKTAALSQLDLEYDRLVGPGFLGSGFTFGPGSEVRVAPAAAPVRGRVEFLTHWVLNGTPDRGTPYRYDAGYEDAGAVPADQHRIVATSQLATLDARYGTGGSPTTGYFGRTPVYTFQFFVGFFLGGQPAPLVRTEYLLAPPSATWLDSYIGAATDFNPFNGIVDDGLRVYPAGSHQKVDWLRGPLAPGVVEPTNGASSFVSNSCRTAGSLTLALAPFTDTTPGHIGSIVPADDSVVQTFTLARDGTRIVRRPDATGGIFTVPTGRSVYQATVTTDAGFTGFTVSTHAVTTLTFPSSATTGAPLPTGWFCPSGDAATLLPLLTTTVPLPTDLAGTMPIGANSFVFQVSPAAGTPSATVVGVHLERSVDGGASYTAVTVTPLGGNRFRATITNPAAQAGRAVTLRLSGHTAGGSAITQTVTHAYTVAGS